jgi:hypothetical protein
MDNLNISRNLFLGLNNHNATFQLLRSRIKTGTRNNKTYYIIPARVIYRTMQGYYSFIITYNIYQEGDIRMDINKNIYAKNYSDYMALKCYCGTEVYRPCDLLRNYFNILGLIDSKTTIVAKHGLWVWQA